MRLNNFVYNVFLQKLDFFTKIKYIAYELVERPRFNLIRQADCSAILYRIYCDIGRKKNHSKMSQ